MACFGHRRSGGRQQLTSRDVGRGREAIGTFIGAPTLTSQCRHRSAARPKPAGARTIMEIILPNRWQPRPYQRRLWSYLEGGGKRAVAVWHRRAGKDEVCL